MKKRLTEYAACAGCASKLAAGELAQVLGDHPAHRRRPRPRRLPDRGRCRCVPVGGRTGARADGRFLHADRRRPVQLRPDRRGQRAERRLRDGRRAAHGARDRRAAEGRSGRGRRSRAIFRGGSDKLREAGVALLGGHTVTDPEIKFGYAITGEIDPARMLTNAGARDGRRADPDQAARHRHHRDRARNSAAPRRCSSTPPSSR